MSAPPPTPTQSRPPPPQPASSSSSASRAAERSADVARKTFEIANNVQRLDPATDAIFHYDADQQKRALNEAPWKKDPNFFRTVRISCVALIKMVIHARSGGIYEVMGLMQGKVDVERRTLYVMDAFALPVEGTETRVNAQNEAYEFMVDYLETSQKVGRKENVVGWYHSHPGYGCWLSGIDVNTQMTNQQYQDPFVAVVIDPNRTVSAGRVDIGAFRTYPPDYKPPNAAPSEYQSIPLSKIEDFGVHANSYYPLQVEHFKSSLDDALLGLLWDKYWAATLSQSPSVVNRSYAVGQVRDLAAKLTQAKSSVQQRSSAIAPLGRDEESERRSSKPTGASKPGGGGNSSAVEAGGSAPTQPPQQQQQQQQLSREARAEAMVKEMHQRRGDTPLAKAARDSAKISSEANHGMLSQLLKDVLFNRGEAAFAELGGLPPV